MDERVFCKERVRTEHTLQLVILLIERDNSSPFHFIFTPASIRFHFFQLSVVILGHSESVVSDFLLGLEGLGFICVEFSICWIIFMLINCIVNCEFWFPNLYSDVTIFLIWVRDHLPS